MQDLCSLRCVCHTVGSTLGHRPLPPTPPHAHTVDDIALLGLVPHAASLVRALRAGSAVDDVELAELYRLYSQQMFNEYDQDTGISYPQQLVPGALCRSLRWWWVLVGIPPSSAREAGSA